MQWDAIKQGEPYGIGALRDGRRGRVGRSHDVLRGNVIRSNRFEHLFTAPTCFRMTTLRPRRNLDFHDNLILDCGDDGIETDGVGSNCRIYSNVFSNFRPAFR